MHRRFIIHPILFALYPVLALYAFNINYLPFGEVFKPAGIMLVVATALSLLCLLFKDSRKPALVASLVLIFFFSFGHAFQFVTNFGWRISEPGFLRLWQILLAALCIGVFFLGRRINGAHAFFMTASIVLVTMTLVNAGMQIYKMRHSRMAHGFLDDTPPLMADSVRQPKRDIYYIILDRYASNATLKREFHFNDSAFFNALRARGFYIAEGSNANYLKTALSLAASLNLSYINTMTAKVGEECNDWQPVYSLLQDYRAWRFLRSQGYRFIHFGAWWEGTSQNDFADLNVNIRPLREFTMLLLKSTMLYPRREKDPRLKKFFDFNDWELHYRRILYQFGRLVEMPAERGPVFIFAHLLIPHDPFVFDSSGRYVTWEEMQTRTFEENYVRQLKFTNKKVLETIDILFGRSSEKPIILLQADEGPYPLPYRQDEKHFQWRTATQRQVQQKLGILNAYYLPDADTAVLYASISPVNSLRVVFNAYFGTRLPLLPDKSYGFKDDLHPYSFFDVTEKAKRTANRGKR
jgi:hypothetical protein